MHELLKYFKQQSLFSIAFIPFAAYYTCGHKLWFCECTGCSKCCSLSVCNHLDTCDSLHVTNLPLRYIASILLSRPCCTLHIYLYNISDVMVTRYVDIWIPMNLLLQKFTFIENEDYDNGKNLNINHKQIWYDLISISLEIRPFYKNFIP